MSEKCQSPGHCGTQYPGWIAAGRYPTVADGVVTRKVCFSRDTNDCCYWSEYIKVRNCGEFFVYQLKPAPRCPLRYCGNAGDGKIYYYFFFLNHLLTVTYNIYSTCTTLHYTTLHYTTLHYTTLQYNTIQYNTIQYNTIQYNTIQYNAVQYSTVQYSTIQYNTIQYYTILYNTIKYNTIQYNTIQYNTLLLTLLTIKHEHYLHRRLYYLQYHNYLHFFSFFFL